MSIQHTFWLLSATLLLFSACTRSTELPTYKLTGATMGTRYNITLVAPPAGLSRGTLKKKIATTLKHVDDLASTYQAESELSVLNANRSIDWIGVSNELCEMIERALFLSQRTQGAFDITVGPLVNLWGFGPDQSNFQPPSQAQIDEALTRVGYQRLQTRCSEPAVRKERGDVYVDLSGWAKGYAVDQLAELFDSMSLGNFLIEIGGEIRVKGHNAEKQRWAIGVEKPSDSQRSAQSVVHLTDNSIATSGNYRNYFQYEGKDYSHMIDTRTGWPVSHTLIAVTVIDRSAADADGMATALLVLGPEAGPALAERLGIAGYFLIGEQDRIEELKTSYFEKMERT